MDLATKTYEIKVSEKYADAIRKLVKTLGGTMKVRKEQKCGLDEALEDVKAGRVHGPFNNVEEIWEDLMK